MNIHIRQKFTEAGVLGAILFIVGPAVTSFSMLAISSARRSFSTIPPDVSWLYWVAVFGAVSTCISIPMLIVGRRYEVEKRDAA